MTIQASGDPTAYEWQPCAIMFPRIGTMLSRHGARTRVILPGHYMVRRSRTLGGRIYRRLSGTDDGLD
ncbi:hypothetical protein [Sphingopyxis sp. GW247-27LB]|uniref:hypothetical protein n=1 Tax=Sphingopyxis sp. GW247-27LB TaxID=2012632 RepID=UPI000BA65C4D|nr:hypothetical protein [Sphingopyxis sp. GW247-27LB]PAL22573.1 hypothetical protein CD928_10910 [Sphingopyxis sp. GW247-27LB]